MAVLSVIYAHFGSSVSAAVAGVGRCPLDRSVLNDLCEKSSHEARLRSYYMLRQGKCSSWTLAVGHVLFLPFLIFFPNIITPEEKRGCSEQRWMMQYSANPIIYVLVKCLARLFSPSLWTFVKHLLLSRKRIGQGLQRNVALKALQ